MAQITALCPFGTAFQVETWPDVVQYITPITIVLGTSPTISPSVLAGAGNVAETGAGTNDLSDMNATLTAATGAINAGVGGYGPVGTYSFELARNSGTAFVLVVYVVIASGGGRGPVMGSAVVGKAVMSPPVMGSPIG